MRFLSEEFERSPVIARYLPLFIFVLIYSLGGIFGADGKYWMYAGKTLVGVWLIWEMRPFVLEMRWAFSWDPGRTAKAAVAKASKAAPKGPKADDAATRGDRSKRLLDLVMLLLRARTPVTYREIREQFPAYQTAQRRGRAARVRARQGRPARARRADPLRHPRRGRLARGRRLRDRSQALPDARGPAHPRRDLGARARRLGRARDAGRHLPEDRRPRAQEARVRPARAARHADRVPAAGAQRPEPLPRPVLVHFPEQPPGGPRAPSSARSTRRSRPRPASASASR